jgi:sulfite reductase (NADPH) hemoprotein beta-component
MYRYDDFDRTLVNQRAAQFRGQVQRRFDGVLGEEEFRPLRLMNGFYQEMHAYMQRIAIPYGTLSSTQLRELARIARTYDRGYGHFTTRQNIQFNWLSLTDGPDILDALAAVELHAIQSSGSCIRNVTADHFAGAAADEVDDPRVWAEIVRQWSTLHPEFTFLPRKFKIAFSGSARDRAALAVHDIGLRLKRADDGEIGFEVLVGGGLGRTPLLAKTIRDFLPTRHLLSYLEAILRVYNRLGRRDNKYKARIKIMVHELGAETFTDMVEAEWAEVHDSALLLPDEEVARIRGYFAPPAFAALDPVDPVYERLRESDPAFSAWAATNVAPHKVPGYAIVTISLKAPGKAPGDATDAQMDGVADIAESYSFGEVRVSHEQNLVLPHVRLADLHAVWTALDRHGLATPNVGLATDVISCPGMDFCSLANARSIPIAQEITRRLDDLDRLHEIGEMKIKMSGCINACGHHHIGHIGILGVDKRGEEFYQITLGGNADETPSIGTIIGPAFAADQVVDAVETLIETYLALRADGELFIDTVRRVGLDPFKEKLYARD